MSAAQPKSAEPSMEEILASIRRIISDDQVAKPAGGAPAAAAAAPRPVPQAAPEPAAARPAPAPKAEDDEDVLDLAPKPPAARQPEPHFITDDPVGNDVSFEDPSAEAPRGQGDIDALMAAAEFEAAPPEEPPPAPVQPDRLVSPHTDRMVTTAFSSLSNTILANNARTLDNVVEEMMRPMIKSWLDDNLPGIVERLVRAEIERVSRGGR
jgi:uncharacterized protein